MNPIDLHVHTLASGHAMNTLYEIVAEASQRNIQAVAITDHGPAADGAPDIPYFHVLCTRVPKILQGVRIFKGIEANILDAHGSTDLPPELIPHLDLVLAGTHPITCYRDLGEAGNTKAIIKALQKNPAIDILAHPVNTWYPINVDAVVAAACEQGVALELNESAMVRPSLKQDRQVQLVERTLHYGGRLVLTSDAHVASEIGGDTRTRALLAHLQVPEIAILNRTLETTEAFIESRGKQQKRPK